MAFESKTIKSDASTTIATIAVDTVSGVDYPVSQLIVGADGSAKTIVSGTTGLPVTGVYSESVAAPNPIVGQAMLMERDDALSTLEPSAGEWAGMRCDANGALWVSLSATASTAVTNAGTFAVQVDGSALTALQLIDDIIYADDADWSDGSSKHALVGGLYQSTPQSITDGDVGPFQCTQNGFLIVADGGGSITVDGTVTANLSATDNAVLDAMVVDLAAIEVLLGTIDADTGAIKTAVEVIDNAISGSEMQVDVVASLPAGSAAIGKLAANSGVDIGDVDVTSIVPGTAATNLGKAQDASAGGTDTGVAAMAVRDDEVAVGTIGDGDYVNLVTDKYRRLRVTNIPSSTSEVKFAKIDVATSGDNTLVAAAGGGIKIRVLQYVIVSAGTVTVRFESAAGGTALTGQMNLVANTGVSAPYCPEGLFETADNALLNLELSGNISVDGHLTYVEI